MTNTYGKTVWYDLFSNNVAKTTAFYSELFNWNTEVMPTPNGEYTIFKSNGKSVGGVTKAPIAALENTWLAYVSVENLNSAKTAITQNGGTLLDNEVKMPSIGSWQVAKDPQGGIFCAFQGEQTAKECSNDYAFGGNGQFCWHELMCKDYKTAFTFYSQVFGWEKSHAIDMGPMGTYQTYMANDLGLGGMMSNTPDMPQKTHWLEYINVENADETFARAKSLGATNTFPLMNVNNNSGRIAGFIDPNGAAFAIHSVIK